MIIPSMAGITNYELRNIYGNWEPNSVVPGFNAKKTFYNEPSKRGHRKCDEEQIIRFTTNDVININSLNTYFIVNVYDGFEKRVSVRSSEITKNTQNLPLVGTNTEVVIKIEKFQIHEDGLAYSIKPTFEINIGEILGIYGGRFSVEIIHVNDLLNFTYKSEDMFFNRGILPKVGNVSATAVVKNINDQYSTMFCSGLRYIKPDRGYIRYLLTDIDNLNKNAATAVKVSLDSVLLDKPYEYKLDNSEFHPYINHYDADNQIWSIFRPIANGLSSINNNIPISGKVYNAFGSTEFKTSINLLLYTPKEEDSANLIETFNDESRRLLIQNNQVSKNWPEKESVYKLQSLMVIPGQGLAYPFGDYTNVIRLDTSAIHSVHHKPTEQDYIQDPAYQNIAYNYDSCQGMYTYYRQFKTNEDKSLIKQSGVFIFDGLTKEEFLSPNFECEICVSNDIFTTANNASYTWYDLTTPRGTGEIITNEFINDEEIIISNGILADLIELPNNRLAVKWALNDGAKIIGKNGFYLKIGMNHLMPNTMIKRIELRNYTMNKSW